MLFYHDMNEEERIESVGILNDTVFLLSSILLRQGDKHDYNELRTAILNCCDYVIDLQRRINDRIDIEYGGLINGVAQGGDE